MASKPTLGHGAGGISAKNAFAKADGLMHVVAWRLSTEMEKQGMTKAALAERMHTSRARVDCIFKAKGKIMIERPQCTAALVG